MISFNAKQPSNVCWSRTSIDEFASNETFFNDEQPENAHFCITLTEEGISILGKPDLLKAEALIAVIDEGIFISFNDSQDSKVCSLISFSEEGSSNATCFNDLHSMNAQQSIKVTEEGIFICSNEVQLPKAYFSMDVIVAGILIEVNNEQLRKVPSLITVISGFSPNVIFCNDEQSLNAY